MAYIRRYPRERYESIVVAALVACGYNVTLSTDEEDEILGFDCRDNEHGIRIDLYIGNGANGRYAEKLAKAESRRIHVFHIPADLVDDINLPSCRESALPVLKELYYKLLRTAGVFSKRRQVQSV